MGIAALVLIGAMNTSVITTGLVSRFPGDYYDTRSRSWLQRQAMTRWPSPEGLLRMWSEEKLSERQRMALLLGGAAFHDPVLLPAYREAIMADSQRLRQAAAYGYRDLLADRLPDVRNGIDDESAKLLADEMELVERTLRRRSLLEMWLESVLLGEGLSFPGWKGVALQRRSNDCFRAAEKLVDVEDLDLLVRTYQLSEDFQNRVQLMKLIEAVSLSRFFEKPTGERQGWGMGIFISGLEALDATLPGWIGEDCLVDTEEVLRSNLALMGVRGLDPLSAEGCIVWQAVLLKGRPRWWSVAARRLYACGGPFYELSALQPDREANRKLRNGLVNWYRPKKAKAGGDRVPTSSGASAGR
ncbi:MAG: hypothetical protein ACC742_03090 [Thermoanaerobaculales bacterium]